MRSTSRASSSTATSTPSAPTPGSRSGTSRGTRAPFQPTFRLQAAGGCQSVYPNNKRGQTCYVFSTGTFFPDANRTKNKTDPDPKKTIRLFKIGIRILGYTRFESLGMDPVTMRQAWDGFGRKIKKRLQILVRTFIGTCLLHVYFQFYERKTGILKCYFWR